MMTSAAEAVCIGALHKFLDVHMLPNDGVHGKQVPFLGS